MKMLIQKFFITALVGVIFLFAFVLLIETTTLTPDQNLETAYFMFLTPWIVWGFFYFLIPLFNHFFHLSRRGK